jgi:ribosomal protein S21
MVIVKKKKGESDQSLIMRFRKEIAKTGQVEEIKNKSRFTPASEKRKEQKSRLRYMDELKRKRIN